MNMATGSYPGSFGATTEQVEDIIYFSIHTIEDEPYIVKKIPTRHGPLKKRGKGKANRDWEK